MKRRAGKSVGFTLVEVMLTTVLAAKAVNAAWELATGDAPPEPNDPDVPLRRALVTGSDLPYPEGVAAAEVLKVGAGVGGAEENKKGLAAILLPTVDPISLAFEVIPLLVLFEASIWASVLLERRWATKIEASREAYAGSDT